MTTVVASRFPKPIFEPVLERFTEVAATHFGSSEIRLVPVRYEERPYSYILRVAAFRPAVDSSAGHVFVKVFKPKPDLSDADMRQRVSHDFDVTTKVRAAMSTYADLGAVTPLACYPDLLAIVTEETAGETLLAYLDAHARWHPPSPRLGELASTMARAGRWVRAFQRIDPGNAVVRVEALRDYVDIRLQRLVAHQPAGLSAVDAARILDHIDDLGTQVKSDALREVTIHADLAPGNILVASGRIVVLDLAMMRRGVRLHDLARLWMQLDLLTAKPAFRTGTIRAMQDALLQGFEPGLTVDDPLFRLVSVLHRINHLSTLLLRRERFPARVYNTLLIRMHRRWLEQTLACSEMRC